MSGSIEMNSLLTQMRELQSIAKQDVKPVQTLDAMAAAPAAEEPQFSNMFKQALDNVNELQTQSGQLQEAYIRGEDVDITRVMVASQKSSIGFQAVVQVRNKLVDAYKDIMNMPV